MPTPTVPADAGTSSNAATPAADAALVNAASPAAAATPTGAGTEVAGSTGSDPTVAPQSAEKAPLGADGEPEPVGNEAQKRVREAIAATIQKTSDEPVPEPIDLNEQLKGIIKVGQTQSAAGPKPVELKPVEEPAPRALATPAVQVKAKGTVTPPPAAAPPA